MHLSGPTQHHYIQLLQWIFQPLKFLEANFERYGDLYWVRLYQPFVFVNHPAAVQQLLTHDTQEFSAPGEQNQILAPLVGQHSLLLQSGAHHRRQRQLLMPSFHGEALKAYAHLIVRLTQADIETWPLQRPFAVRPAMQRISMGVILEAVFGLHAGERHQRLRHLLGQLLELVGTPLTASLLFFPALQRDIGVWSPGGQLRRLKTDIDQLLFAEISQRRSCPDPTRRDILSLLLEARDADGEGMGDQELRDELMTLLLAGHETTATAMTWALYWIHALPEIQGTLRQELDASEVGDDAIARSQLPFLNAVCKETLRIYPVAPLSFARQVERPTELMGYPLEPGTVVMADLYSLHHRPDLYPNPSQFRPQRFLERSFSPYEFMPFGGGSRRCVGAALAQLEMALVISTILTTCRLAPANRQPVRPQRRGVTIGPSPVKLLVTDH
ncbi:cytochrome P450 [Nodosilinea sp. P-1105]|uniref:cytochrome P450 n=1 Tax=Nodosilinea sp. P-1105 TaxID=2546229 RepID=UPI00146CC2FA|nr:cytochrome P450 [Nodosilinea sp. P-1105]NMF82317.1 cytochrome P450 [Nodosilinea sp. P-1105]